MVKPTTGPARFDFRSVGHYSKHLFGDLLEIG